MLNYKQDIYPYTQRPTLGTTILGFKFKGGLILAADTQIAHGSLIGDDAFNKIKFISDNVALCCAGDASCADATVDYINHYLRMYQAEVKELPPVETCAKCVRKFIFDNRSFLGLSTIVGGYDKLKGFSLYRIFQSGAMTEENISIGGSGSTFISGFIDENWKENMEFEEAKKFAINCVKSAIKRDVQSGGSINLVIFTEDGIRREIVRGNEF